jgi:NADPH2:quinone reductase
VEGRLHLSASQDLPSDDVTVVPIFAYPTPEALARAADNHEQAHTGLTIQQTFALTDGPQALAAFTAGTLGKLIVVTA